MDSRKKIPFAEQKTTSKSACTVDKSSNISAQYSVKKPQKNNFLEKKL